MLLGGLVGGGVVGLVAHGDDGGGSVWGVCKVVKGMEFGWGGG